MLPDPIKIMETPHIKRDPGTDEVSWPPPQIELELIELGLIPRLHDSTKEKESARQKGRFVHDQD